MENLKCIQPYALKWGNYREKIKAMLYHGMHHYIGNVNTEGGILIDTMFYIATYDVTANVIQDSIVNDNSSLYSVIDIIEISETEPSTITNIPSNHDPPLEPSVVLNHKRKFNNRRRC